MRTLEHREIAIISGGGDNSENGVCAAANSGSSSPSAGSWAASIAAVFVYMWVATR